MKSNSKKFNPAIIVMAKVPLAGTVKTRLRPFLTDDQCAEIAWCFLKDTVAKVLQITPNVIVAFAPAEHRKELAAQLPENVIMIQQRGKDLGARMISAIRETENIGFSPIITVGTDSPTLPLNILHSAVENFGEAETDVILGASKDGGYYLVGIRKSAPELFENISWSSEFVYRETIENARRTNIKNLRELPVWYDVDTPAELAFLCAEIIADEENFSNLIPETYRWIISNETLFRAANY